ncbi:hypothetical protein [Jiangella rhizosphaerae]|uniref:Uncharacterized protein n=1 Tax=Jiangella rhizosphaerae TaxID=2293569 RepID=A0A418KT85_9ACTN|nr:hypothetical protein [Jiangella rhizosphaerae]RIQ29631.1 hypothetical protein DY240_08005 [Jiangella rhizosphaerae]
MKGAWRDDPRSLARAQGAFNLAGGLWPIVSVRSFEAVFGPKEDRWLEYTVAGLLSTAGVVQLTAPPGPDGVRLARRLGLGVAATLLAIDLIYVPAGRLRWTYLLDGAAEAGWIAAWVAARDRPPREDDGWRWFRAQA